MAFDLATYLARIGLSDCAPTPTGLAALQRAQMETVAFENIDPFTGIVPELALDAVWTKLVLSARGGYCFELNALLGEALQAIGFDARPVLGRRISSARVDRSDPRRASRGRRRAACRHSSRRTR